ncbi:hypothetical protein [Nonomuraea cavernae]|uniref:hypothetical protein n=1 Tax=Nonomuraea cavernae TaxID=2045107 RepID=UPI0033FFA5A2
MIMLIQNMREADPDPGWELRAVTVTGPWPPAPPSRLAGGVKAANVIVMARGIWSQKIRSAR